jgi:hypothetical protein
VTQNRTGNEEPATRSPIQGNESLGSVATCSQQTGGPLRTQGSTNSNSNAPSPTKNTIVRSIYYFDLEFGPSHRNCEAVYGYFELRTWSLSKPLRARSIRVGLRISQRFVSICECSNAHASLFPSRILNLGSSTRDVWIFGSLIRDAAKCLRRLEVSSSSAG